MMLHIRNMESSRCISLVEKELIKFGLHFKTVELGEVELKENLSHEKLYLIDIALRDAGLELIADKKSRIIEMIKAAVCELVNLSGELPKPNSPCYISKKVNRDYTYLSNLFSGELGITIEKYIIAQKIERAKEMLEFTEITLNDIAFELHYSSVAHLSNQFKRITGLTPSFFKQHLHDLDFKSNSIISR